MPNSHGHHDTRTQRSQQQRYRGENTGPNTERNMENRWETDGGQNYDNSRPGPEPGMGGRNMERGAENREWVSGTGQSEYRGDRGGSMKQSFAGRGPQGYKRSDERITEDINEAMTIDRDLDPTNITVETKNGEVTLKGSVTDRESKRRAEEIAESCSGVKDVQNQIRVKREETDEKMNEKRSNKMAS